MVSHDKDRKQAKPISLPELAQWAGGRLDGAADGLLITGIAPILEAKAGDITFLSDAKQTQKHLEELRESKASAVIAPEKAGPLPLPGIRFENPYQGFARVLGYFHPDRLPKPGIHPTAFVHEEAVVHPTASIGPLSVVEAEASVGPHSRIDAQVHVGFRAVIGESVHLHPQVMLGARCVVGDRTVINAGAIIGSDGFGFYKDGSGHAKVPQVGIVEIGTDVEIGANVTIDRATMGKTTVGDGTKIDNLVHLAHNVKVGRNCIIVAQVGISGSTTLEDNVTLAGQVGTVGHVRIGHGTTVAARGVVTQDVDPNSFVSGFPLKPHQEERRIMAAMRKLPELLKTVRELKDLVGTKETPER